ncbi:glycosyltransferase [Methylobacterium sp. GXS13]|uniref:glycosyltransferase family 4 protein n=1 Tax=Methylobacterium sp. GXS13 TaxID=1730094 RepID=UPI0009EC9825|nr:glycosyltransferase [Methylobacterium sp. GXS13]
MAKSSTAAPTRILICNERFLARFGVDRILILLAKHLVANGAEVSFACLRCDRAALEEITHSITIMELPDGIDLAGADEAAANALLGMRKDTSIDILITGGWPFFGVAARAPAYGVRSVFIDAGAVPHDGFPESALPTQRELRRLRQATLPFITKVLPISSFICETQTEPDRGGSEGVTTVLLGADHMSNYAFKFEDCDLIETEANILAEIDARAREGKSLILGLGRYESAGYKNSPAVFDIMRSAQKAGCSIHILLLTGPDEINVPADLVDHVTAMPTVSDVLLQAAMERCVLGLSLSLWEGFNLPIAEMQWLGRPVLAFAIGAHSEVIADPWLLCSSLAEMEQKTIAILHDGLPSQIDQMERFQNFRDNFSWTRTLDEWSREIFNLASNPVDLSTQRNGRRLILMDVTNSARDPGNSGVIRVTRRLAAVLVEKPALEILFVQWNASSSSYELLSIYNQPFLSSNAGPSDWVGRTASALNWNGTVESLLRSRDPRCPAQPILLFTEVILDHTAEARVAWGESRGCRTAFVFYDMLPIYEPRFVDEAVSKAFPAYLSAVSRSDSLFAISGFSLNECERWHRDRGAPLPAKREVIWLPAQFSDHPRIVDLASETQTVRILCTSTIEPRKNHRVLIEAFRGLRSDYPNLEIRLDLVGNRYGGAEDLAAYVQRAVDEDEYLVWHGILPDSAIAALYEKTDFTVYPSLAEGFGLPIMESLWMGRPCLCHSEGVMAELAEGGGCLTVDMSSAAEVKAALKRLVYEPGLRQQLNRQALNRQIGTWATYGESIVERLKSL